jgi:hypothetical protein
MNDEMIKKGQILCAFLYLDVLLGGGKPKASSSA